jgi:ketosteroid isomerase-like protein
MRRTQTSVFLLFSSLIFSLVPAFAQQPATPAPSVDPLARPTLISPLTQPTLTPGELQLIELEARFAADVAKGGGKAFASWFAEDAVTLNDGKPAVLGRRAIAANANWDPKSYQLTWTPQGAQMGASGDTGFTWGHYTATGTDDKGGPFTFEGRYITFWKKVEGAWKVALDASAKDAPAAGECCALPTPGGPKP